MLLKIINDKLISFFFGHAKPPVLCLDGETLVCYNSYYNDIKKVRVIWPCAMQAPLVVWVKKKASQQLSYDANKLFGSLNCLLSFLLSVIQNIQHYFSTW